MSFHEIQWYDRNALSKHAHLDASGAPHAATLRLTYVVPKDRKAMLELVQLSIKRLTAAATESDILAYLIITTNGESSRILTSRIVTNNVGDSEKCEVGGTIMLNFGDRIDIYTFDGSTGGTIRYFLSYKVTEFDAYLYVSPPKTIPFPPGIDIQQPAPRPDPVM
jgi:hypothetical protein